MINYIIVSSISLGLLLLVYLIVLRRAKLFHFNRYFLLSAIIFSLTAPFYQIELQMPSSSIIEGLIQVNNQLDVANTIGNQELSIGSKKLEYFNYGTLIFYTYLIITLFMLIRFSRNLNRLIQLTKHKGPILKGMQSILMQKNTKPFSFFNYLFIGQDDLSEIQNNDAVITHEKAHAIQKHSIDILFIEFIHSIIWFNPILIIYKKAIRLNHEFLADDFVTNNQSPHLYLNQLLNFTNTFTSNPLSSGFSYINIKNRIKMIHQSKTTTMRKTMQISTSLILAFVIISLCSFKPSKIQKIGLNNSITEIAWRNVEAKAPYLLPIEKDKITKISSHYGMRYNPLVKKRKMHTGIDIIAPQGTPIIATSDGTVEKAKFDKGYGNHIKIKHNHNFQSMYAHLSSLNVVAGQKVKAGDIIGIIGNSGKSIGIHLHYEIIKDGEKVDPINYFEYDIEPKE